MGLRKRERKDCIGEQKKGRQGERGGEGERGRERERGGEGERGRGNSIARGPARRKRSQC